jgi:glycosyltransferase involved in cell wall biosynthesis
LKIGVVTTGIMAIYLKNGISSNNHESIILDWMDNNILDKIDDLNKCDFVILTGCGQVISSHRINILNKIKPPKFYWVIDTLRRWPEEHNDVLKICGKIFISQKDNELLKDSRIQWFPLAYDHILFDDTNLIISDEEKSQYECNVLYVGTFNNARKLKFFDILSEFDFKWFGNNPPGKHFVQNNKNYFYPQYKEWSGSAIYGQDFLKATRCAKINVNMHYSHFPINKLHDEQGPNPKTFELVGMKNFVIVDNVAGVLGLFKNNEHLVVYNTLDGLRDKIKFYLENDKIRARIAESGAKEVREKHTYQKRIQEICDKIVTNA